VDRIATIAEKSTLGSDRDHNGVEELTACFAKPDLRRLFDSLPSGRSTVPVTLTGTSAGGGEFRSDLSLAVIQSNALEASVAPNPAPEQATLSFRTTTSGRVKVSIYDVSGRLLGVPLEASSVPAGYHDVAIEAKSLGRTLAVGVYFFRVDAGADAVTGRFSVVR
jgi:hypothetical protein